MCVQMSYGRIWPSRCLIKGSVRLIGVVGIYVALDCKLLAEDLITLSK